MQVYKNKEKSIRLVKQIILFGFNLQRHPKPSVFVHPRPCAVLPNFFSPQQIRQQVKFSAPTIPTAQQDSSKGKPSSKGKESPKSGAHGDGLLPKPKPKAADWTLAETKQLLHACASRFERLKGAYNKVRTAIWNEIYTDFKSSWDESDRTLPQVKKRQQNLEYEFRQLRAGLHFDISISISRHTQKQ